MRPDAQPKARDWPGYVGELAKWGGSERRICRAEWRPCWNALVVRSGWGRVRDTPPRPCLLSADPARFNEAAERLVFFVQVCGEVFLRAHYRLRIQLFEPGKHIGSL